jgi:tetratricopeptide (TPR) repeat protein
MEALSHLLEEKHLRKRAETTIKQASVSWMAIDPALNLSRLAEVETLIRTRIGDKLLLARVHFWMGRLHSIQNNMREAIGYYRQVLEEAQEAGDIELLAIPATMIGRALMFVGEIDKACDLLSQAVAPLEKSGNWTEAVYTNGMLGVSLAWRGFYSEGLSKTRLGLAQAIERKIPIGIVANYTFLCAVHHAGGYLREAMAAG